MKQYYTQINIPKEKKLYSGLDQFVNSIKGDIKGLFVNKKRLKDDAKKIFDLSLEYENLKDEDLDQRILSVQNRFKLNKVDNNELIKAFALVVELGYRVLKKRAYVVQIFGALCLYKKFAIEMATGEGKTITASIAGVILGFRGKPVHILTSNDYLASRDAESLKEFYNRANLSVGAVIGKNTKEERKELYALDIVYSTGKEILADFLKDRMMEEKYYDINNFLIDKISDKNNSNDYLLRGLDTVIVDEADSVLADDAVTPLIISSTAENKILKESVLDAYNFLGFLKKDLHYKVYEKFQDVALTKEGSELITSQSHSFSPIYRSKDRREFLVKQAIMAKELFHKDKQYIIKEGKVVIVDEKTGRIMSERTWSNGLHQAIEVKEDLELTDPTTTFSKMSFQRFFRLYKHLCGMSGTLQNLKNEFWQIYGIQTVKVPKRVPSKMNILDDKIFLDNKNKEDALIEYIINLHEKKIPVLIGVTDIKDSKRLADRLNSQNIECTLLNAHFDEEEALIIAKAGELGSITIATNMAGRGTDIHICDEVNEIGGLHVITIQRDKSRRVDLQFYGRCARQGQKGTAVSFLSLEDMIIESYTPKQFLEFYKKNFKNNMVKKAAHLTYIFYQKKIEKDISSLRNKTLQQEFSLNDSISFSNI